MTYLGLFMVPVSLFTLNHFERPQESKLVIAISMRWLTFATRSACAVDLDLYATRSVRQVHRGGLGPRIARHVRRERCHVDHASPPLVLRPRRTNRTSYVLDFP